MVSTRDKGQGTGADMAHAGLRLTDQSVDTLIPGQRIGQTVEILFVGRLNDRL